MHVFNAQEVCVCVIVPTTNSSVLEGLGIHLLRLGTFTTAVFMSYLVHHCDKYLSEATKERFVLPNLKVQSILARKSEPCLRQLLLFMCSREEQKDGCCCSDSSLLPFSLGF